MNAVLGDLAKMQGLVVRGFTHRHSVHLPVAFSADHAASRELLSVLLDEIGVTPATQWIERPRSILNLSLTAAGLTALGVSPDVINLEFPPDFTEGAAARLRSLGDTGLSDPGKWWGNSAFDAAVHGVLHVYGETEVDLAACHRRLLDKLHARGGKLVEHNINSGVLEGRLLPESREHFGFMDGISQPQVAWAEIGITEVKPRAGRPLVDPSWFLTGRGRVADGKPSAGKAGALFRDSSYLVLRVMQQDVTAFKRFCEVEGRRLRDLYGAAGKRVKDWPAFLGAKMIGRWSGGQSLVSFPFDPPAENPPPADNEFGYRRQDNDGGRCPFSAHIRLANPRDQLLDKVAAPHGVPPLLRRGVPYGPDWHQGAPDKERGLIGMFICASINRQFERLLGWTSRADFSPVFRDANGGNGNARDPVVATRALRPEEPPPLAEVHLIQRPGATAITTGRLDNFVTTRGTIYLMLPSIPALRALAQALNCT